MALGTFTLVVDGEQLGGNDETTARLRLTFQGRSALKDAEADKFLFLNDTGRPAGAAVSLPYTIALPTDVTEGVSEEIGYTATLTTENGSKVTSKFAARPNGATVTLSDLTDTVISPVGDTGAAVAAAQAAAQAAVEAAASIDVAITGKVDKDSIVVSVKDHGATGDGATDDTAAFAVATAIGGELFVPPGTYIIDPDYAAGKSIRLTTPGTRLRLAAGATLLAKTNALGSYTIVSVEAADCSVEGGTVQGDRVTHTGGTGESGHGIAIRGAAHRARLAGVNVKDCWGDGIIVGNDGSLTGARPEDVHIVDCVSSNNRRNNLSLISAVRPTVTGGKYLNANGTSPQAGICVEPNAAPADQDVTDALFVGVTSSGNAGRGFQIAGHDRQLTAKFIGCVSDANGAEGFAGGGTTTEFSGCSANGNTGPGFYANGGTNPPVLTGCSAKGNTTFGFSFTTKVNMTACDARDNGSSGFYFGVAGALVATGSTGTGLVAVGNNTTNTFYGQITVDGSSDVRLTGCVSDAGPNVSKPNRGYRLTATATNNTLLSCATRGTFSSGAYSDIGTGNMAFPTPGAAKQTGTPAAATDPATTQALANDLRTKLLALGLIS